MSNKNKNQQQNKPQAKPANVTPATELSSTSTAPESGDTKLTGIKTPGDSTQEELDAANQAAGHPGHGSDEGVDTLTTEPAAPAKAAGKAIAGAPANKALPGAPANKAKVNVVTPAMAGTHTVEVEALDSFHHKAMRVTKDRFFVSPTEAQQLEAKKLVKILKPAKGE